jgi:4-oxalocrotonate tautomerase
MPLVTIKALEGRTIEQRRKLAKDITDAIVKHFGAKPDSVIIDFIDYSKQNLAKAGELFIDRDK